jgi:ribulose-phosphate 3-epimerase
MGIAHRLQVAVMKAFVSLWSADLLNVGQSIDDLAAVADGFHVDVMDGHFVPGLLFGPDFVRSLAQRTHLPIDVHLMVMDADSWIGPFSEANAQSLVIHTRSCRDPVGTLGAIRALGLRTAIALEVDDMVDSLAPFLGLVDRIVLMGTQIGIKGVDIDADVFDRVREAVALRNRSPKKPEVFVDGGIRRTTVPTLAGAGCDGVYPGSLVLADPDPAGAVRWLHSLAPAQAQ